MFSQDTCSAVSAKVNVDSYDHLQGLQLADTTSAEIGQQNIDVLIGSDYYFDVVSGHVIRGSSGPTAVSSLFGWISVSGPTSAEESREMFASTDLILERPELMTSSPFDIHSENDELSDALQKFWYTESLGVLEDTPTSQLNDGEFLPWKEGFVPVSNEYDMCVVRLRQLH